MRILNENFFESLYDIIDNASLSVGVKNFLIHNCKFLIL